LLITLTIAFSK